MQVSQLRQSAAPYRLQQIAHTLLILYVILYAILYIIIVLYQCADRAADPLADILDLQLTFTKQGLSSSFVLTGWQPSTW